MAVWERDGCGTSTRKKMEELGICENILTFEPEGDKDGTD